MKGWKAKVKGYDGFHNILDVIAPQMGDKDQSNYYDIEGLGHVHQSLLSELTMPGSKNEYSDPWDQAKYDRSSPAPATNKPAKVLDFKSFKKKLIKSLKSEHADSIINELKSSTPKEEWASDDHVSSKGMLASYKERPHDQNSIFMKYLIHRMENIPKYKGKSDREIEAIDKEWLDKHRVVPEKNNTGLLSPAHLHSMLHSSPDAIKDFINHRENLHNDIKKHYPHNIINENGKDYVYLTRGLNTDKHERLPDLSIASYGDIPNTGFGQHMHYQKVPLDNVWYSYEHHNGAEGTGLDGENEFLVSPHETEYTDEKPNNLIGRDFHDLDSGDIKKDAEKNKLNNQIQRERDPNKINSLIDLYGHSHPDILSSNIHLNSDHINKAIGTNPYSMSKYIDHDNFKPTEPMIHYLISSSGVDKLRKFVNSKNFKPEYVDKIIKNSRSDALGPLSNYKNLSDSHISDILNRPDLSITNKARFAAHENASPDHVQSVVDSMGRESHLMSDSALDHIGHKLNSDQIHKVLDNVNFISKGVQNKISSNPNFNSSHVEKAIKKHNFREISSSAMDDYFRENDNNNPELKTTIAGNS